MQVPAEKCIMYFYVLLDQTIHILTQKKVLRVGARTAENNQEHM